MKSRAIKYGCLLILIIGLVVVFVGVGKTYVESEVTGTLYIKPGFGQKSFRLYYVEVDTVGTMIVHLKWNSGESDAKAVLRVYDQDDKEIKAYSSDDSAFAYVNISDLGDNNLLEYKIRVEAFRGDIDYSLHIVKPGEVQERQVTAFKWIWMFDVEVENSKPKGEWIQFLKKAQNATNITVKVFNENAEMIHIDRRKTGETVDISAIKRKLTPGHYKLQIADNSFNRDLDTTYREFITSGVTPLDIRTDFLNRSIQGGQKDKYTLNLQGEKFIWFVWEKVLSGQAYPHLEIGLYDSKGGLVRRADAEQGTGVLKVSDLRGIHDLKIWSATPVYYAFGIENREFGSYSLATLQDYVLEDTVGGAEAKLYSITFADNLPRLIDIVFTNRNTGQVNVTVSVDGVAQPALTLAAGQRYTHTLTVTPQGDQKKSTVQILASGKVNYTIDMDYSAIEAKVVKDSLLFDPAKLVYLQGNINLDWKKINKDAKGSYLYWDYETLPLLLKTELTSESANNAGDYVALDKWELVPVAGVTQNGANGNKLVLEPLGEETKTGEHNAILIFKDELKYDRLMVKWMYNGTTSLKVGTLKGYRTVNGKDDLVIEEDLYLNKIDLNALWEKFNHKSTVPWFQSAYDNIALVRDEIEWVKVWKYKNKNRGYSYGEEKKTSSCTIPLQMLIGQVGQETSYGSNVVPRYEPFKDAYCFGEGTGVEGYVAGKLKEKYPEYIITDESGEYTTIFDYVWPRIGKNPSFGSLISADVATHGKGYIVKLNPFVTDNIYPPGLWLQYETEDGKMKRIEPFIVNILNNVNLDKEKRMKNAKKYLEILLNYGPNLAEWWYNNGMQDKDDPTCFAYIWDKIGRTYNSSASSADWSPDKWPNKPTITNMNKRFEEIHKEGLVRDSIHYSQIYLEIFINYGKQRAENWDNNYYKKRDSNIKELYDPTRIRYIWEHIGSTYKVNDTLEVSLNPSAIDSLYSPEQWLNKDTSDYIKNLKKDLDELIIALNNQSKLEKDGENLLIRRVMEYLIKYGKEETLKWINLICEKNYSIPTHGYFDPEMCSTSYDEKIIKPFIAQKILSSSYGHLQVLVTSAYMAGYTHRANNDLSNFLNDPSIAFEYGVRFLATEKMWIGFNQCKIKDLTSMQNAGVVKWVEFWDEILLSYNGGSGYKSEVRKKEYDFIVKVGMDNE